MDLPPLAVTGVTGEVGGRAAHALSKAGVRQRLLSRDPARAPRLPGAMVVPFGVEYGDRAAAAGALAGVEVLLMVSAAENQDRLSEHEAFVEVAAAAGVRHVVYTSFVGAAPDATFTLARDHHATEQLIRAAGLRHTFLRDNLYLDVLPRFVGEDGVLRGPGADGRVAAVARADVGRAAAVVLAHPEAHRDRTYQLTGPTALTLAEVAAEIAEAWGRQVTYHAETVAEAYESRRRWEPAPWQADAWVSTYTAIAAGEMEATTGDVRRLTGRSPLTLREVLAGE